MIPIAGDPPLNERGRALCAAIRRSRAFVSGRDKIAQGGLKTQREVISPWNLRKGRTRNYVSKIFEEPRVMIHEGQAPSIDMVMSPAFVFEEPCLPSIVIAPTLLWGFGDYWNGLLPDVDRLKHSHVRPLEEHDISRIAILMNRPSAFLLWGGVGKPIPSYPSR